MGRCGERYICGESLRHFDESRHCGCFLATPRNGSCSIDVESDEIQDMCTSLFLSLSLYICVCTHIHLYGCMYGLAQDTPLLDIHSSALYISLLSGYGVVPVKNFLACEGRASRGPRRRPLSKLSQLELRSLRYANVLDMWRCGGSRVCN
jgi:hypothetical protein